MTQRAGLLILASAGALLAAVLWLVAVEGKGPEPAVSRVDRPAVQAESERREL